MCGCERIAVEEVAERVNGAGEKFGEEVQGSETKFGDTPKSSESGFGEGADKPKNIGKTAQKIIDFVISDPSISADAMAKRIGISSRAVEKQIAKLRAMGIMAREGADFGGYWRVITITKSKE